MSDKSCMSSWMSVGCKDSSSDFYMDSLQSQEKHPACRACAIMGKKATALYLAGMLQSLGAPTFSEVCSLFVQKQTL